LFSSKKLILSFDDVKEYLLHYFGKYYFFSLQGQKKVKNDFVIYENVLNLHPLRL